MKDQYQYVLAVHTDHEHLHCHIVFNNTNMYTHRTFETEENQGGKAYRAWAKLRAISDEICKEHGISVIEQPKAKGKSHFEWEMEKVGKSWKAKLRQALRELISYSKSFDDFLQKCVENGIEYDYKPQNKVKLKFRFKDEGQQRFTRADTLGAEFEPDAIIATIETAEQKAAAAELAEKFLAARRARHNAEIALRNHSAVSTPPKTEPTQTTTAPSEQQPTVTTSTKPAITAPTKPTVSEPTSNLSVMTEEEYIKILEEQDRQAQAEKAAKKAAEVDPWAEIRGMGRSAEIIADLESSGIKSLAEFREFFWNTPHEDDHTKELATLRKQYRAIDTLIAKIQHRDELEPIYKEYQGKKGWAQSRFKKKNSAKIEDYERTVAYIKKHGKPFIVDGELMPIYDLMGKSNDLKRKYNELLPEHTAFQTKYDTAHKYVTKAKSYLAEQHNKREREKSRQRTQAKHKKNYLE